MKTPAKLLIVAGLAVAVVGALALKKGKLSSDRNSTSDPKAAGPATEVAVLPPPGARLGIPRLVDVGAGRCIPCKMMAPILEELKKEYDGRLRVDFVDVWVNPAAGEPYKIEIIPAQIFYDAQGNELFRHVGFFAKEDILAKWKELGIDLNAPLAAPAPAAPRSEAPGSNQVVAYYFHGTVRCEACLKIERLSRETLEQRFAPELAARQLVFASVNYDVPSNQVYVTKYKLPYPSLVVVRGELRKDEQWKRLDQAPELVETPARLSEYVATEVGRFLREAK